MIRRFGDAPERGRLYRPRPGVYAVLRRGKDILLTYQEEPDAEFQLPGGGIDPGESPSRALHREVLEETGWTIGGLQRIGAYRRFAYMPEYDKWADKLCHIYTATPGRRLGDPSEKGHSAVWLNARDALRLIDNAGERHFLKCALAKRQS